MTAVVLLYISWGAQEHKLVHYGENSSQAVETWSNTTDPVIISMQNQNRNLLHHKYILYINNTGMLCIGEAKKK